MLIQYHRDHMRFIAQHHHSLVSGELASHWRGTGPNRAPLGFELVLATALHDLSWLEADEVPLYDEQARQPYDFVHYPQEPRVEFYSRGLSRVSAIHPYAGLLGSMHYSTFDSMHESTTFQNREKTRREQLKATLGLEQDDDENLQNDLSWLKLFDRLSLFVCLTSPSIPEANRPGWLTSERLSRYPGGSGFIPSWKDADSIEFEPFPFDEPFDVNIPYRDVAGRQFQDEAAWRDEWNSAALRLWTVRIAAPPNH